MIKNVILSTLAIAVLAGCSGKKDSDKDTSVVEAIPVKVQKLEKENIARTLERRYAFDSSSTEREQKTSLSDAYLHFLHLHCR